MARQEDAIRALGCVVKMNIHNIQDECSACGVLLNPYQGIIVSHGSILTELCLKDKSFYSSLKLGHVIKGSDLNGSKFEALIDGRWAVQCESAHAVPAARETSYNLSDPEKNTELSVSFTRVKCVLLYAFRNVDFSKAVARIMPDSNWTFTTDFSDNSTVENSSYLQQHDTTDADENSICFNLLSYFLVLKIAPLSLNSQNGYLLSALRPLLLRSHNCQIGNIAEIIATPFGSQNPSLFFNSFSRGVVCNVSGTQGCWILTDARCIPGSEGGPLFTGQDSQSRHLSGVIAASLCWKNKEWIGFSLACSVNSIYGALDVYMKADKLKMWVESKDWIERNMLNRDSAIFSYNKDTVRDPKRRSLLSSTVAVRVGSTWGSGIIIDRDKGIFLTCSHVVKDSRSFDSERVCVVGHALFSPELDLQPSVSAGVISKVITLKGQPVMIQSTCAVHAGASGGPLLNLAGDLIGIVVCNTVDKGSSSSYPHINMSIPAVSVWPAVKHYLQTGDPSGLSVLELTDACVQRLWALEDSSSSDEAESFTRSKL
ncbi:hypothetical protein BsWGS_07301 [Bradybaena similaris]